MRNPASREFGAAFDAALKGKTRSFDDETLLCDLPADTTEEQAIQVAVERNSWA